MRFAVVLCLLTGCELIFKLEPPPPDATPIEPRIHLTFDDPSDLFHEELGHLAGCRGGCPLVTEGRIGDHAASFAGAQCLEVAAPEVQPAEVTWAMWLNLTPPAPEFAQVFSQTRSSATTGENVLELIITVDGEYKVLVNGTSAVTPPVTAGEWHHVAVTFNNDTAAVYFDGMRAAETGHTTPLVYGDEPYELGCDRDLGVVFGFLHGAVDDLQIYDQVLSSPDIAAIAATPAM